MSKMEQTRKYLCEFLNHLHEVDFLLHWIVIPCFVNHARRTTRAPRDLA